MRHFYILRCPAPCWLIQCKPYQNRFIIAKVIDKRLGARFYGPLCTSGMRKSTESGWNVWEFLSLSEEKLKKGIEEDGADGYEDEVQDKELAEYSY